MYYLYHLVLRCTSYLCAAILQLYRTYSLYYPVLCCSSDLCAAHFYYSASLKKTLRTLAETIQLVEATASLRPPSLKRQWWCSRSRRPPSTIDLPVLTYPHRVDPTDKSCKAFSYNPFLTQHAKFCEPVQYFFIRLPAPPSYSWTDTQSAVRQSCNYSLDYLPL